MATTLDRIKELAREGKVRISEHGYDELSEDDLSAKEIVQGIDDAALIEDYPDYPKGHCVLVLQRDGNGKPVHVVWGIPKGYKEPAVLVTAYRPDPQRWDETWMRRRNAHEKEDEASARG